MKPIKIAIILICLFSNLLRASFVGALDDVGQRQEYDLGRIIVVSDRWGKSESRLGSNITVIDSAKIEKSNANNLADLLQLEGSINVGSYSTTRKNTYLDLRGFGESSPMNILVLIDGRRVNQIDISGVDWLQISLRSIERIEIIRGSASVLYGDNAVGGVINIVTKKGEGKLNVGVNSRYGSYNMNSHDTEISGSSDKFSYYFYSQYFDTDGYRDNDSLLSKNFNSRLGYDLDERIKFDLSLGMHKDKYGLPGALSVSDLNLLGRRGTAYPDDRGYTRDRYIKLQIDTEPAWDDLEIGNFIAEVSLRKRKTYSSLIAFGVNSTTSHDIDNLGLAAKYKKEFRVCSRDIEFITGIDFYEAENFIESRGYSVDDIIITKGSLGYFVLLDAQLIDALSLSMGYRLEKNNYTFDQAAPSLRYEQKNPHDSVLSTKLFYEYASASNVYLGYEENFRFPATDEWYSIFAATGLNTLLEPQSGRQYEFGLKHSFNEMSKINATVFLMDIKDEIFYNPLTFTNENYDRTRRKGIDLGFEVKPFEGLTLFSNYTYQMAKFRGGDFADKEIPAVPNNLASCGLRLVFLDYFHASLSSKYTGSRYLISDQRNQVEKLKHHLTVDGRLSYNRKELEVFIGINNIFNQKYSELAVTNATGTAKNFYPAPERNFMVGMSYRF